MAYTTIDPNSIEVGDPVKKELLDRIKSNEDDLDSRITNIETGNAKVPVFSYVLLNGSSFSTATGLDHYQANQAFTLTNGSFRIFTKGSLTGTVELDVKRSTTNMDNASFTSVFTTKPKITFASASDYATTVNQVFNSGQINIAVGDILRLDITAAPTNGPIPALILMFYGEL